LQIYEAFFIAMTALIFSKLLDCMTTLEWVTPHSETNPIAAPLMRKYGMQPTVWAVFAICCALDFTWALLAYRSGSPALQGLFIVWAALVSIGRTSVAHTNATGRFGPIERAVLHTYKSAPRIWGALRGIWNKFWGHR